MRVSSVKIGGYRSFAKEVWVYLAPKMTCVIGANECGKSNLLRALDLLDGGTFEDFDRNSMEEGSEWPRMTFVLSPSEREARGLLKALREWNEAFPDPLPDDQKQLAGWVKRAALHGVTSKVPDSLRVALTSDGVRRLYLPGLGVAVLGPEEIRNPVDAWLRGVLPRAHIFRPSEELADGQSLDELNALANPPFVGLLMLADLWDRREELFLNNTTARHLLAQGATRLTWRVVRRWTQAKGHKFLLAESGGRLHLNIQDPNTFDTPSTRSLGFKSFFSFYLTLLAETGDMRPEGTVLLFDEPGTHLHPQGQKDLLKELRRLAETNQIVYATHSPFMIDRNYPEETILLRKGTTKATRGTHVVNKPHTRNWLPLHSALGMTASDAFFPPDRVLVVEGSSDKLTIIAHMKRERESTRADLNNLFILDADRRNEVSGLVRILLASDREIVVLTDSDHGGDELEKRLTRIAGSKNRKKLTFLDLRALIEADKEVSIEDALDQGVLDEAFKMYVEFILESPEHSVDFDKVRRLASNMTLGKALAEYLVEEELIDRTNDLSKTTLADLYCQKLQDAPPHPEESLMRGVCIAIVQGLGIAT